MMFNIDEMRKQFIKDVGYEPSQKELMEYIKNKMPLDMSSSRKKNTSKLTSILIIIWFISSFVSLMYLSSIGKNMESILVFGHYFLVFGITALISTIKKNDNEISFNILYGTGLAFLLYINFFSENIRIDLSNDQLLFLVLGSIFFIVGVVMLVSEIKKLFFSNLIDIEATVCDYKKFKGNRCCVYEFDYCGHKIKADGDYYTNIGLPAVGTIQTIKINSNNPLEVHTKKSSFFSIILAIPFVVVGGMFVLLALLTK